MDKIISMKDIRLSLAAIARRVETGESFTVVRDSKPVFRIEPLTEAGSPAGKVRDSGETEWPTETVEMEIPEKIRKKLHFPEAKLVFHEDGKGNVIVRIAEPPEFTREEWGRFLRKTAAEPLTRVKNRKEALRHLDYLADPK